MATADLIQANERVVDVQGSPVFVREAGTGPPILFLHGPEDPAWTPALAGLAAQFRVVAPDHPGMGRTPLAAGVDTMTDLVAHYADLMDALGLAEATLVGVSFGGWIAAEVAVAQGSRLRRLVLVDAAGLRVGDADLPEIFLMSEEELARFWVTQAQHAELVFPPTDNLEVFERRVVQRATLARFCWQPYWHNPRLADRLRRITARTLVLWGAHDRFISRAHAQEFRDRIPGASLRIIDGAGHLPHLEDPERFVEAVATFAAAGRRRSGAPRNRRRIDPSRPPTKEGDGHGR
jgi:pimeloyl-ACP methyl ester carboxylesterase